MKVPFYGHVRQYQSIKSEIDAKMQEVLDERPVRAGADAEEVRGGAGRLCRGEVRHRRRQRHRRAVADLHGARPRPGRRDHHQRQHLLRHRRGDLDRRRHGRARRLRPEDQVHRSRRRSKRRSRKTHPGHRAGPPLRPVRRRCARSARSPTSTACSWSRTTPRRSTPAATTSRSASCRDAVCTSFIIQKNLGTFGDGGAVWTNHEYVNDRVRKLRNHGSTKRDVHSFGLQQPPRRPARRHPERQAQAHRRVERPPHRDRRQVHRRACKDCDFIELPYAPPGYRHVFHLYVIETKNPADRDAMLEYLVKNGVDAKTHYSIAIHQQEGFPWGKPAAPGRPAGQRREERRLLHLAARCSRS